MAAYFLIAFIVALFAGDNGKLSGTECILLGIFWLPILIVVLFVYGILYIVSLIGSIPAAIKRYKYKMYVNKQIIEMVKEFNDKSE